jgi:hypothetical protein
MDAGCAMIAPMETFLGMPGKNLLKNRSNISVTNSQRTKMVKTINCGKSTGS